MGKPICTDRISVFKLSNICMIILVFKVFKLNPVVHSLAVLWIHTVYYVHTSMHPNNNHDKYLFLPFC